MGYEIMSPRGYGGMGGVSNLTIPYKYYCGWCGHEAGAQIHVTKCGKCNRDSRLTHYELDYSQGKWIKEKR